MGEVTLHRGRKGLTCLSLVSQLVGFLLGLHLRGNFWVVLLPHGGGSLAVLSSSETSCFD